MKQHIIILTCILISQQSFSQYHPRFSAEVNYGLVGNFFVKSYDEFGGPDNKTYFYKKNFLGSISGLELSYKVSSKSSLFIRYNRSVNSGRKNFEGIIDDTYVFINDFKLTHVNNIFQLGYGYLFKEGKPDFRIEVGPMVATDAQQTIEIENFDDVVRIEERNFKNSNLMEGGVFFGFGFARKLDTRLNFGVKGSVYYLISTTTLEAVSLTPFLAYRF